MLGGIHLLLTYACNLKCDHCFLYCSSKAKGTMTLQQITHVLRESQKIGTVQTIYFEGGEPFLFYPVMLEGIRQARQMGFKTGIVSNAYWSTGVEDAKLWLKPLSELGISDLSLSDDDLHYGNDRNSPAKHALVAAKQLNLPVNTLCKSRPEIKPASGPGHEKGAPEISGGIKLRGRAVEKYADQLPTRSWKELTTCPYEDLAAPRRVHIDSYGNVQACQGLSMGNCREKPLSEIVKEYHAASHPICGPLVSGGPARLVEQHGIAVKDAYVDECHLCYAARLALLDRFPEYLAPRQVYGLEEK